MIKTIQIDQVKCIGCELCSMDLPEIIELDKESFKCKIKKDDKLFPSVPVDLSEEQIKKVEESVQNCPVQAILLS